MEGSGAALGLRSRPGEVGCRAPTDAGGVPATAAGSGVGLVQLRTFLWRQLTKHRGNGFEPGGVPVFRFAGASIGARWRMAM